MRKATSRSWQPSRWRSLLNVRNLWPQPDSPIFLEVSHPRFQTGRAGKRAGPTRRRPAHPAPARTRCFGTGPGHEGKPVGDAWWRSGKPRQEDTRQRRSPIVIQGSSAPPRILKPGPYTVVVQSGNHAAAWRTIEIDSNLTTRCLLSMWEATSRARLLPAMANPWPAQQWAGSSPLFPVSLQQVLELQAMTATDADGKFRLGPLPEGEFQITALAQSPRRQADVVVRTGSAKIIKLPPQP